MEKHKKNRAEPCRNCKAMGVCDFVERGPLEDPSSRDDEGTEDEAHKGHFFHGHFLCTVRYRTLPTIVGKTNASFTYVCTYVCTTCDIFIRYVPIVRTKWRPRYRNLTLLDLDNLVLLSSYQGKGAEVLPSGSGVLAEQRRTTTSFPPDNLTVL